MPGSTGPLTLARRQAYYLRPMADQALTDCLAKTPFFGGLAGTPVFDRLADMLRERAVKKGEVVLRE